MKLPPYFKHWEKQQLGALLVWATDYHQETHMPVKGILQRDVALQMPMVKHTLISMATRWEPEGKKASS